jgi:hypothetical protein
MVEQDASSCDGPAKQCLHEPDKDFLSTRARCSRIFSSMIPE